MDLSGTVEVGKGTWSKSESVVWTKEGSHEGLTLGLVDLSSSVIVILFPEVVEVGSDVVVNLIIIHNVESSDDISGPLWATSLWELPDSGTRSKWVLFLDSVSLENIVHDIILISTVALVGEMVGVTGVWSLGWWGEGDGSSSLEGNSTA